MSYQTPDHCDECRALAIVREELERIMRAMPPETPEGRVHALLDWFAAVGNAESTLADFIAYGEAVGCENDTGVLYPVVTLANMLGDFDGQRAADRPEAQEVMHRFRAAKLIKFIGTHQRDALKAAAAMFPPKSKESKP